VSANVLYFLGAFRRSFGAVQRGSQKWHKGDLSDGRPKKMENKHEIVEITELRAIQSVENVSIMGKEDRNRDNGIFKFVSMERNSKNVKDRSHNRSDL
jgi:hypothetical protein